MTSNSNLFGEHASRIKNVASFISTCCWFWRLIAYHIYWKHVSVCSTRLKIGACTSKHHTIPTCVLWRIGYREYWPFRSGSYLSFQGTKMSCWPTHMFNYFHLPLHPNYIIYIYNCVCTYTLTYTLHTHKHTISALYIVQYRRKHFIFNQIHPQPPVTTSRQYLQLVVHLQLPWRRHGPGPRFWERSWRRGMPCLCPNPAENPACYALENPGKWDEMRDPQFSSNWCQMIYQTYQTRVG